MAELKLKDSQRKYSNIGDASHLENDFVDLTDAEELSCICSFICKE
jgi:hypothetical protein